MENNEKMKNGKVLVVLVCLLSLGMVLLGSYSLYDKFYLDKNNNTLLEAAKKEIKNKENELSLKENELDEINSKLKQYEDKTNKLESNEKNAYSNFLKKLKNNRFLAKKAYEIGHDYWIEFQLSKKGELSYEFWGGDTSKHVTSHIADNVVKYEVRKLISSYYMVYYLTEDGTVHVAEGSRNQSFDWEDKKFKTYKLGYKNVIDIVAANSNTDGDVVYFIDINGNVSLLSGR